MEIIERKNERGYVALGYEKIEEILSKAQDPNCELTPREKTILRHHYGPTDT